MTLGMDTFWNAVNAIATSLALVAALGAAWQATKLYRIETERDERSQRADRRRDDADERDREREKREHASQISAWAAMRILHGGVPVFGIVVRNSSNDPIYDAEATCHGFTTEASPRLHCVPPGEYFVENTPRVTYGKQHAWDYLKPVHEIADPVRPFTASENKRVDSLTFRNNVGTRWRRAARGELTVVDPLPR